MLSRLASIAAGLVLIAVCANNSLAQGAPGGKLALEERIATLEKRIAALEHPTTQPADAVNPAGRGAAVIDLDRVAKAMGRDRALAEALQMSQAAMQQTLNNIRNQLLAQIQAEEAKVGPDASAEQKEKINKMRADAETFLRSHMSEAQAEQQRKSTALIAAFRDEVRPHVQRIMRESGMSMVIVKHEGVLIYEPDADITDRVISSLLGLQEKPTP